MGSGSTLAAANAAGLNSIGIERHPDYYEMSREAIPKLTAMKVESNAREQLSFF
jgi:site-specific DNA-methyltransferase (adenine-specific)